jgi:sporulation protein YlmC with PRC-barrel domain
MSNRRILPLSAALAMLLAAPVMAQTTSSPATMSPAATSPATASSSSYMTNGGQIRASKLIGGSVYNDQHQSIGSIDDLLMDGSHNVTSVILSVGGFLGVGGKLVKVPYTDLHVANNTIVLPNATKDELKKMPSYEFHAAS